MTKYDCNSCYNTVNVVFSPHVPAISGDNHGVSSVVSRLKQSAQ